MARLTEGQDGIKAGHAPRDIDCSIVSESVYYNQIFSLKRGS